MKRYAALITFLAATALAGRAYAGAGPNWDRMPNTLGDVRVNMSVAFRSTQPATNSSTTTISGPVTVYKVIVGSAAAVNQSTGSVLSLYNSTGPATDLRAKVQVSTTVNTNGNYTWQFDAYYPNGLTMWLSTGPDAGEPSGYPTVLYYKGIPPNYQVYNSTFIPVDTATHTINVGSCILHSIKVLKAGTGSQTVDVYNATSTNVSNTNRKVEWIATALGEQVFDAWLPSGLVVNFVSTGTTAADVLVTYQKTTPTPIEREAWNVEFSSTAKTTKNVVVAGPVILGGVFNGNTAATGQLTVYDSTGPATGSALVFDANQVVSEKCHAVFQNGLTYSTVGTTPWSILYRRVGPVSGVR